MAVRSFLEAVRLVFEEPGTNTPVQTGLECACAR
jgi:hypothetical protein